MKICTLYAFRLRIETQQKAKEKSRRLNEGRIAKSSHRQTKNFCYFYILTRSTMHNNIHLTTELTQSSEWLKPKEKRLFALSANSHKTYRYWLKLLFRVGNLNECENETMKSVSDSRGPTLRVYAYNKVCLSGFVIKGRRNKMWEMGKGKEWNASMFNIIQRTQMLSETVNIVLESRWILNRKPLHFFEYPHYTW